MPNPTDFPRAMGGGNALWEETYRPLNVVPFAAGCSGVQMTGWFKKEFLVIS